MAMLQNYWTSAIRYRAEGDVVCRKGRLRNVNSGR